MVYNDTSRASTSRVLEQSSIYYAISTTKAAFVFSLLCFVLLFAIDVDSVLGHSAYNMPLMSRVLMLLILAIAAIRCFWKILLQALTFLILLLLLLLLLLLQPERKTMMIARFSLQRTAGRH